MAMVGKLGPEHGARRANARTILSYALVLILTAALIPVAAPAVQLVGDTARVSIDTSGAEKPGASLFAAVATGPASQPMVAFQSQAALVSTDTNGLYDVYLRDVGAGETVRVSGLGTASEPTGASRAPALSLDSRFVAYESDASELVADDENNTSDVFVLDRETKTTVRASVSTTGTEGELASRTPSISGDGSLVVFVSDATTLVPDDTNGRTDVFIHDLVTGETRRVSETVSAEANGSSDIAAISADGSTVVLVSKANNLVPGDVNGRSDIFAYDVVAGTFELVSVSSSETQGNLDSQEPSVSEDGRFVTFESASTNLVAGDGNLKRDIFLRDRQLGTTVRISGGANGVDSDENSSASRVSLDGRFVAFSSRATALAPGSTDGVSNVYVWDALQDSVTCVGTAADGEPLDGDCYSPALSPDGRFAAFHSTASNLVASDTNVHTDVFVTEFAPRRIERVAGATRYATAVEASKNAYPADGSADAVVLATGRNWPDALGGAALAGAVDGPLLLCDTDALPAVVAAEIERLGADTVYVLGGEAAVSADVYSAAGDLAGVEDVVRIAGATRYQTAQQVAEAVHAIDPAAASTVFVATGRNFPDALAASPVSAATRWPILLADPARGVELPAYVTDAVMLGGTSVLPATLEAQLEGELGASNVERWWGANRYATAVDVAEHAVARTSLRYDDVTIATGERFPDALSGGVMAGRLGGVLLLTTTAALRTEPASVIASNRDAIASAWIMGGEAAVSQAAMASVETALGE